MKRSLIALLISFAAVGSLRADEAFPLKGATVVYADRYRATKDEPWGRVGAQEMAGILSKLTASDVKAYPESKFAELPRPASGVIYVGPVAAAKGMAVGKDGRFAFRVKVEPNRVFLLGRNETGTSYAITEFLERCCGYRFLAQNGDNPYAVDPARTAPCLDLSLAPAIPYRYVYRGGVNGVRSWVGPKEQVKTVANWGTFFRQRRLKVRTEDKEPSHLVRLENHSDCHNAFAALPPEKYAKPHPEWYSMDENGHRVSVPNGGGQLCFSNLAMRDEYVKNLLEKIRADREKDPVRAPGIYDCAQLDNTSRLCFCPECKKVIAKYNRVKGGHREGGDAGLQLEFANDVAARVAAVYPDVLLRFFAYVSTEEAPQNIEIHPNVLIWWCDVYSVRDHMRPLTDPLNRKNHGELVTWAKKLKNLQVWAYLLYGAIPEVNAEALAADAKLFRDLGIGDVFMESEYGEQPFYDLHLYLLDKLYFNPDEDVARLIRDWCAVYGAASEKMQEFIAFVMRLERENPPADLKAWHQRELPWLTVENFERMRAIAEAAYARADSRAARCRVANVLFCVNKMLMGMYASKYGRDADLARTRADYVRYAKEWGACEVDDPAQIAAIGRKLDDIMAIETLRFKNLPPELEKVPSTELKCLDLRSGKFGGGVPHAEDPLSEAGKVVRLEFPKPVAFPIPAGAYDVKTAKVLERWSIPRPEGLRENEYFWTRLGEVTIGLNTFIYMTGSWRLQAHFRSFYVNADGAPVDLNRYEVWVSLRVTGPAYFPGSKEPDAVWYDRVALRHILPKTPAAQAVVIVSAPDASKPDRFAAEELQLHLRLALGRDVPIVATAPDGVQAFELGTARARSVIGAERVRALQEEESLYVVRDGVVAIAGGGKAGLCYGVYTYLERELGARWFDQESAPVIRKVAKLDFSPREYREKPRLDYRMIIGAGESRHADDRDRLFFFRNRSNHMDGNYGNCTRKDLAGKMPVRILEINPGCHSLFLYVPPHPKAKRTGAEGWHSDRAEGYFAEHPEWYTLNRAGQRVDNMQLCLTNPELRRKLTENLLARIAAKGGKGFVDCSAQDVPGELCYCTNCLALSKKYKSKGAPLFDYLHELAPQVKARFPEVIVHFLVYRREQTQHPPVGMPPWPDNLAAVFAPIDNDFSKDYLHPNNREAYEDLKGWCRLVKVWTWYYPFTYDGRELPKGGLRRTAVDMRLAIEAGLDGGYVEHDVGTRLGLAFADAETWMLLQHYRNPDTDWKALRKEFFDFSYGAASPEVIRFSDFLEAKLDGQTARLTWDGGVPWRPTAEELVAYTKLFDEAERKVAGDPARLQRVREIRIGWDAFCLVKGCPDLDAVEARIGDALAKALARRYDKPGDSRPRKLGKGLLETVKTRKFLASVTVKPLPKEFDGVPESRIFQIYPTGCMKNYTEYVKDGAAATGFTLREPLKKGRKLPKPYPCGFYDGPNRKFVLNTKIAEADFGDGEYRFHKLGTVPMPNAGCSVWFGYSWALSLKTGVCYRPGSDDRFDVWASLRFEKNGTVSCDRLVLVRLND